MAKLFDISQYSAVHFVLLTTLAAFQCVQWQSLILKHNLMYAHVVCITTNIAS
jgi:hypothetical protein